MPHDTLGALWHLLSLVFAQVVPALAPFKPIAEKTRAHALETLHESAPK